MLALSVSAGVPLFAAVKEYVFEGVQVTVKDTFPLTAVLLSAPELLMEQILEPSKRVIGIEARAAEA